ncbi:MAG: hypothetical protein HQL21_01650 [Candidatus Omnitrophica bacterium]|nr:hypothetical protein [Candidatus Omnitrophota bacterium]
MKISCSLCHQEIAAEDINLSQEVAKCSNCNNVFSFSDKISSASSRLQERPAIEMPRQYEIRNDADGFVITRRWLGPAVIFLAFFCLFWNGFMVFWFTIAITQKIYVMALFGSLHAAVGLGMLYSVLAQVFNITTIKVSYDFITVRHAPLPCPGEKTIPRGDVKQFYSEEDTHETKHGHGHTYAVRLLTKNEKTIDLIKGLAGRDEALFVEQQIEKFLRIQDENVSGEISR